jgi:hypothetical protein
MLKDTEADCVLTRPQVIDGRLLAGIHQRLRCCPPQPKLRSSCKRNQSFRWRVDRMRRIVAIAVMAEVCIVALLLYNDIRDFIWTHPWWHSFLVAIPGIAAPDIWSRGLQGLVRLTSRRGEIHPNPAGCSRCQLNHLHSAGNQPCGESGAQSTET